MILIILVMSPTMNQPAISWTTFILLQYGKSEVRKFSLKSGPKLIKCLNSIELLDTYLLLNFQSMLHKGPKFYCWVCFKWNTPMTNYISRTNRLTLIWIFIFITKVHIYFDFSSSVHNTICSATKKSAILCFLSAAARCRRPCYSGGTCLPDGSCLCRPGFFGRHCQTGEHLYHASLTV